MSDKKAQIELLEKTVENYSAALDTEQKNSDYIHALQVHITDLHERIKKNNLEETLGISETDMSKLIS